MFRLNRDKPGAGLLLEILMIVVGINITLWFESWFQDLQDAEIEEHYRVDLRDDLLTDIGKLDIVIRSGKARSQRTAEMSDCCVMPRTRRAF